MTFELRPEINWNKGDSALFADKHLNEKIGKNFIPIYLGDSDTDEDAFKALKDGITIRVGKFEKSAAKWYLKNQKEVEPFLKWLLGLSRNF
jgi:trehalose 6-phosphate phosphatase